MVKKNNNSLLFKYFKSGDLDKKYYSKYGYIQPFSAKDRFEAGVMFYKDFISWKKGHLKAIDLSVPRVRGGKNNFELHYGSERFRRVLRKISTPFLPILYKIILEEVDIKVPVNLSTREKLYFNHEIKLLLCRGLDELVSYYNSK